LKAVAGVCVCVSQANEQQAYRSRAPGQLRSTARGNSSAETGSSFIAPLRVYATDLCCLRDLMMMVML